MRWSGKRLFSVHLLETEGGGLTRAAACKEDGSTSAYRWATENLFSYSILRTQRNDWQVVCTQERHGITQPTLAPTSEHLCKDVQIGKRGKGGNWKRKGPGVRNRGPLWGMGDNTFSRNWHCKKQKKILRMISFVFSTPYQEQVLI